MLLSHPQIQSLQQIMTMIKDWVFIHIPRTGGTYIESLFDINWTLENEDETNENNKNNLFGVYRLNGRLFTLQHLTATELSVFFNEYILYKKFTVVRNPYHRIISLWDNHREHFADYSFTDFLELLKEKNVSQYDHNGRGEGDYLSSLKYHFIPQHLYTHNEYGKQLVDTIFYYESMGIKWFLSYKLGRGETIAFSEQKPKEYYEKYLSASAIELI